MRFLVDKKLNIGNPRFLFSVLLGTIFGFSVYSYWLVDVFPSTSLTVFICLILAGFVGTFGYFILLELWIVPQYIKLQKTEKLSTVLWGGSIGLMLMFASTSAWTSSTRYFDFLLPDQNLEINVPASKDGSMPEVSILWITTSQGDVSYDSMQFVGWVRDRNRLNLTNSSANNIRWQGQTGAEALILFRKSPSSGPVSVSWNGVTETINLRSAVAGTYQYSHQFDVPIYASVYITWLVVLVNFVMMGISIRLLFLSQRSAMEERVKTAVAAVFPSDQQQKQTIDIIIIALIVLLAVLLRIFNLENLYPYADEYTHLNTANELINGASLDAVYERSLFIVTLPVVIFWSLFGESLWAARLPGVLFNILGIFPLYLITRRVNRQVAILSCVLFATSPYIIAYSRNIREYAHYPFYFYWVVYFMMRFLRDFPHSFVLLDDWRKLQWKHLVVLLVLILPVLYAVFFDRFSTFKLILIAYGVFGLFLFARFNLKSWSNWFVIMIILTAAFVMTAGSIKRFLAIPSIDLRSLEYFFLNPPQQWYFDRLVVLPVLAVLAGLWFAFQSYRRSFVPALLYALFAVYMLFFVFFFKETAFNIHPRFVLAAQIWFIPVLGMGGYMLWEFVNSLFTGRRAFAILSACVFVLLTFNPRQTLLSTFSRDELMPITSLFHDDLGMANEYLRAHIREDDVLIGSSYATYVRWQGEPVFGQVYTYSYDIYKESNDGFSFIASVIDRHPSGWIVIDDTRLDYVPASLPQTETVIHGKTVEYVGKFISQHIWRWSVK